MKPLARLGKGLDDRALKIDGVSPMKSKRPVNPPGRFCNPLINRC
jgi:hypothetical protein